MEATAATDAATTCAVAFFDVDGTLVWRDFKQMEKQKTADVNSAEQIKPTPAVYDAFRRMRERGNLTFICTGRSLPFVMPSLWELEPTGVVGAAGAYVQVGDTVVRDEHLSPELVLEVAERFARAGVDLTFESNVRNVELRPSGAALHNGRSVLARTVADVEPYVEPCRFQKFCVYGTAFLEDAALRAFVEGHFTICDLQGGVYECSLKGVDKGTGIEAALRFLNHGRERTFAFGDSENDLSMAPAVETFVAMGNALPQVKEVADYVTLSAADDGVPAGLAHFGLI